MKDAPWVFLAMENVLAGRDKTLPMLGVLPDGGLLIDAAKLG